MPVTAQHVSIDPATMLGAVSLTVSDLEASRDFYSRTIGLSPVEQLDGVAVLGVDGVPLIELHGDRSAPALDRRAPGLYHLAILVPSRQDLAFALVRLASARWPLSGASDHLVSEALYLSDPDGNGIEIYRDRPRSEWPRVGDDLEMATLRLDLDSVLSEVAPGAEPQLLAPPGTRIGHVHLQVGELREAEAFYSGMLGFDVTVRAYPGALFISAGGYHHHIGLNTWHSAGAPPPPPGSIGLRSFEVALPSATELERLLDRLRGAGVEVEREDAGSALVRDPWRNGVLLRTVTHSPATGAP
jgi:catechol 2,3-dioxygenase